MGRFVLSNKGAEVEKYKESIKAQGYKLNKDIRDKGIESLWFFKKKVELDNTYVNGDDYCCCVGGVIFNKKTGSEALKDIYDSFNGNIDALRKQVLGNYCIALKKNGKIIIFVDKYHVYQVYYQISEGDILFSSNIADVITWKKDFEISEADLLLTAFHCSPIGCDTFIKGVKRLLGREYFEIDCETGVFVKKDIPYYRKHWDYKTIDECAHNIAKVYKEQYVKVKEVFGDDVAINMTGGLDSRTVLGGCLAAGIKPTFVHAQSNCQSVVGTEKGDEACVKTMAEKYGLTIKPLNWDVDYPEDFKHWDDLFAKYGFEFLFYGGNYNFFNSYENLEGDYPKFMDTGLFGECLRIREQYNERKEPFKSVEDFFNEYQLTAVNSSYLVNKEFCPNADEVNKHFISRYKEEMREFGFDPEKGISMDQFEEFRYVHHRLTDCVLVNFLNRFTTCFSVLSMEQVCETIYDAKASYRAYGSLQLKVIEALEPELINLHFFSHCQNCKVDKGKYKLTRPLSFNEKCGKLLRNLGLGRESSLYKFVQGLKNRLLKNDWRIQRYQKLTAETNNIIPSIVGSIEKDATVVGQFVNTKIVPKKDSLVHLIYYAMLLHGIKQLKQSIK